MSEPSAWLVPNLGGEEGGDWRHGARDHAVDPVARLWRLLFADSARVLDPEGKARPARWPEDLGDPARTPVFPWLEDSGARVSWIAERDFAFHDKAFALRFALEDGYCPQSLRDVFEVLEPAELLESEACVRRLKRALDEWPEALSESFALKPRLGSSGRGRVSGRDGRADTEEIRGCFVRMAKRGGAILEPWLKRKDDLSAQLWVPPALADPLVVLGTLSLLVSGSGVYRGHRGQVDSRGRVFSGHEQEERVREAAVAVALSAGEQGYSGACGVDAFTFELEGRTELRPIVEFNARYTLGVIVVGLVQRALHRLKRDLGLRPGSRFGFVFALDPERVGGWDELAPGHSDQLLLRLDEAGSGLLFSSDPQDLDAVSDRLTQNRRDR